MRAVERQMRALLAGGGRREAEPLTFTPFPTASSAGDGGRAAETAMMRHARASCRRSPRDLTPPLRRLTPANPPLPRCPLCARVAYASQLHLRPTDAFSLPPQPRSRRYADGRYESGGCACIIVAHHCAGMPWPDGRVILSRKAGVLRKALVIRYP